MGNRIRRVALAATLALGGTVLAAQAAPVAEEIERYCVRCHNERLQTGGLVLETLDPAQPVAHIATWEQVIRKLRAGVMPPAGAPRPDDATYVSMITELETALDAHAAAAPNPGRTSVHRLNRTEYANAIRDLLALEIDGETLLPGDNSLQGFDNIAEVLTMSPGLLERYLLAAKKISRLALGDPAIRPETTVYSLPYLTLVQDERMSEDLPFGSRGGTAVRHYFPVDGDYEIRLYLQRNALNVGYNVRGLDARNLLDLRLDGKRLERFDIQPDLSEVGRGGYIVDTTDEHLRVRFATTAGEHTLGAAFNRDHWYVEGVGMSRLPPASDGYGAGTQTNVNFGRIDSGLDRIEITGPFGAARPSATASRERLFTCRPSAPGDEVCAAEILGAVARRAWRRPVEAGELDMLLGFFRAGRDEAGAFDDGIEQGLVRVLTDPAFLFRVEHDPPDAAPGAPYRLGGLDLASRLSFFLWSSLPDDALIDAAAAGELDDRRRRTVRRARIALEVSARGIRGHAKLRQGFATQQMRNPRKRSALIGLGKGSKLLSRSLEFSLVETGLGLIEVRPFLNAPVRRRRCRSCQPRTRCRPGGRPRRRPALTPRSLFRPTSWSRPGLRCRSPLPVRTGGTRGHRSGSCRPRRSTGRGSPVARMPPSGAEPPSPSRQGARERWCLRVALRERRWSKARAAAAAFRQKARSVPAECRQESVPGPARRRAQREARRRQAGRA